jgi:hypothetical protein
MEIEEEEKERKKMMMMIGIKLVSTQYKIIYIINSQWFNKNLCRHATGNLLCL